MAEDIDVPTVDRSEELDKYLESWGVWSLKLSKHLASRGRALNAALSVFF